MVTSILLALVGAAATAGGGYLIGARAGKGAREALEMDVSQAERQTAALSSDLAQANARATALEASLAHERNSSSTAEELATQVRSLLSPIVGAQEEATKGLQAQMRELAERIATGDDSVEQLETLRSELQSTLAPLVAQDRENHKMMLDVLAAVARKDYEDRRRRQA